MSWSKFLLNIKSGAPEILLGVGIGLGGLAIASTAKGAVEAHNALTDAKYYIDEPGVSEEEEKKAKKEAAKKVVKAYLPTVILASASTTCLLSSFHIQKGRELAMASAYVALKKTYDDYRKRVEDEYGQEAEKKLRSGVQVEEKVLGHDADGKEIKTYHIKGYNDAGCFSYLFDESNNNWTPFATENYEYLFQVQKNLNYRLKRRKYLFLWEVYQALSISKDILGPERWRAAHVIGWIYDEQNPNGDNYIDFGIFCDDKGNLKPFNESISDEPSIWLEFNPDGDILLGSQGQRTFTEED